MTTDTTERGLETLICNILTGAPCDPPKAPTQGADPRRPAHLHLYYSPK